MAEQGQRPTPSAKDGTTPRRRTGLYMFLHMFTFAETAKTRRAGSQRLRNQAQKFAALAKKRG